MGLRQLKGRCHGNQFFKIKPRLVFRHAISPKGNEMGMYTVSQKKQDTNSCPQLPQILTDFQNSFSLTDSVVNLQQNHT